MEELPPAIVKGKSEPLRVWRVTGHRIDDGPDEAQTSFIGRRDQLDALVQGYWRVIASSASRSYVVAGEPGVGKSRLLRELKERLRVADPAPRWFATRCQPYGEDVAFRPAVRLIQAALGMSGSEDAAAITAGLERALASTVADEEREGVRTQLQRLLGLAAGSQDPPATRDLAMAVAALIGRGGPVVLAIEDIHWAESALLELLTTLRDELKDRPVLMVATSRPSQDGELLEGATVVASVRSRSAKPRVSSPSSWHGTGSPASDWRRSPNARAGIRCMRSSSCGRSRIAPKKGCRRLRCPTPSKP